MITPFSVPTRYHSTSDEEDKENDRQKQLPKKRAPGVPAFPMHKQVDSVLSESPIATSKSTPGRSPSNIASCKTTSNRSLSNTFNSQVTLASTSTASNINNSNTTISAGMTLLYLKLNCSAVYQLAGLQGHSYFLMVLLVLDFLCMQFSFNISALIFEGLLNFRLCQ
jgi:hypothetical protein